MTQLPEFRAVHLADLVLLALFAEAVILSLHPRLRRVLPRRAWLPGLLAGLFLALALRAALSGAGILVVAVFLALAFPARLSDLLLRARDAAPSRPGPGASGR
ncbi:MAG: hypothetical protein INR65_02280 [Gluconacetobacter diazotrophicus]|nr:hypothetical protein [Gluconacetobacter diazotrophicus]